MIAFIGYLMLVTVNFSLSEAVFATALEAGGKSGKPPAEDKFPPAGELKPIAQKRIYVRPAQGSAVDQETSRVDDIYTSSLDTILYEKYLPDDAKDYLLRSRTAITKTVMEKRPLLPDSGLFSGVDSLTIFDRRDEMRGEPSTHRFFPFLNWGKPGKRHRTRQRVKPGRRLRVNTYGRTQHQPVLSQRPATQRAADLNAPYETDNDIDEFSVFHMAGPPYNDVIPAGLVFDDWSTAIPDVFGPNSNEEDGKKHADRHVTPKQNIPVRNGHRLRNSFHSKNLPFLTQNSYRYNVVTTEDGRNNMHTKLPCRIVASLPDPSENVASTVEAFVSEYIPTTTNPTQLQLQTLLNRTSVLRKPTNGSRGATRPHLGLTRESKNILDQEDSTNTRHYTLGRMRVNTSNRIRAEQISNKLLNKINMGITDDVSIHDEKSMYHEFGKKIYPGEASSATDVCEDAELTGEMIQQRKLTRGKSETDLSRGYMKRNHSQLSEEENTTKSIHSTVSVGTEGRRKSSFSVNDLSSGWHPLLEYPPYIHDLTDHSAQNSKEKSRAFNDSNGNGESTPVYRNRDDVYRDHPHYRNHRLVNGHLPFGNSSSSSWNHVSQGYDLRTQGTGATLQASHKAKRPPANDVLRAPMPRHSDGTFRTATGYGHQSLGEVRWKQHRTHASLPKSVYRLQSHGAHVHSQPGQIFTFFG